MKFAMPVTAHGCNIQRMDGKSIGARIAQHREAKGLNQSELARQLGVTPQSVQKWESGGAPRTKRLQEIAAILGVRVADLVGGSRPKSADDVEWPFDKIRPDEWASLSDKDKGRIEGYAERLIAEGKSSVSTKTGTD
ncbi:helix-turn-helix domain-containing protein [Alcaligenes nematophilus]|uniref:helix-turn-helix domain-containing protein n=1 Tax=Alcaligenes nematophilus TaxID=2994643 RepID=UPI0034E076F3